MRERVFGSDPEIVGKSINLDGQQFTVAGVLCPGLLPLRLDKIDLWGPLNWRSKERGDRLHFAVGRLRENIGIEKAQAFLDIDDIIDAIGFSVGLQGFRPGGQVNLVPRHQQLAAVGDCSNLEFLMPCFQHFLLARELGQ